MKYNVYILGLRDVDKISILFDEKHILDKLGELDIFKIVLKP